MVVERKKAFIIHPRGPQHSSLAEREWEREGGVGGRKMKTALDPSPPPTLPYPTIRTKKKSGKQAAM